jgi:hypothetical protein
MLCSFRETVQRIMSDWDSRINERQELLTGKAGKLAARQEALLAVERLMFTSVRSEMRRMIRIL